jgi:predicted nucleotidyltransferase component of viral defense system
MNSWDKRYRESVQLLVDVLPTVAREPRFALKGGTAINLFEHDLPRLSVDIDLTWLPLQDFATDSREIAAALHDMAVALTAPPLRLNLRTSASAGTEGFTRLIAMRGRTSIQIETTPVMRGSVHPTRMMSVQPGVQRAYGFATLQVLDFADLYAGKLAAALSRQHPRDLFDIGALLDTSGIDDRLWRTFLVYLTCSPKPAAELLAPGIPDLAVPFERQFRGMTAQPTTVEALLDVRRRLLARMTELLDERSRAFLLSVEQEQPDFQLIGLPQAANLPAVRWKLHNLAQRTPIKREAAYRQLLQALERSGRGAG